MQKIEKSEVYGAIGAILFGIIILLLLFFLGFRYNKIKETEELPLGFAEIEQSYSARGSEGGFFRPENAEVLKDIAPEPKPVVTSAPDYAAQEIEQNIAIERAKAEQKQREAAAAAERLKQQEAERQRIEAERKAKADKAKNQTAGAFNSAGNASGSGSGSGNSGASGEGSNSSGNPVGSGTSNGNSWSLSGRGLVGTIPKPQYNQNVEGKITVGIRVDESGNVISATAISPTDIADETLLKTTLKSAKETKFTPGKGISSGKIEYNFKLN
jgi:TonB family protein